MQGLGRSRNLSSNFGSRALSIVSRLQTLTGGEAKIWRKIMTNSLEFKSAIVKVMVYSWIKNKKQTNHFSPSVRFSILSSKFIIAHVPLRLMCEAACVFHPQKDLKQMLSDEVCPLSTMYAFWTRSWISANNFANDGNIDFALVWLWNNCNMDFGLGSKWIKILSGVCWVPATNH